MTAVASIDSPRFLTLIALCVPTTWKGAPAARLALLHPETTLAIVQQVLDSMA